MQTTTPQVKTVSPFEPAPPVHAAAPVTAPAAVGPTPLATGPVPPGLAQLAAGAAGLGELAQPANVPVAGAGATQPGGQQAQVAAQPTEEQQRQLVRTGMEELKTSKHVLRPGQSGPEVVLMQQQLKNLGLHVQVNGVYDAATTGYIKSLQTGAGLGADGAVGPKTIEDLQKLDSVPRTPAAEGDKVDHMPDDPKLASVYLYNQMRVHNAKDNLTPEQTEDLATFVKNWDKNKARYEEVSKQSGIPAKLIASLHWRESTGDFGTYLHQGDKLGKKAVHEPNDIPIFNTWEPAAQDALNMKKPTQTAYKIDANTQDEAALLSYAERYNGLGYHNQGVVSPYALAGTDQYKKGKYTSDSVYSPNAVDGQLGVLPMMRAIDKAEAEHKKAAALAAAQAAPQTAPQAAPPTANQNFAN